MRSFDPTTFTHCRCCCFYLPLFACVFVVTCVHAASLQEAVSSDGGMEDEDDMEEPDPSGVDNDGNYPAGNAHKRARLVRSGNGVGSEPRCSARVRHCH